MSVSIKPKHIINYIVKERDTTILALIIPYKHKLFEEAEELEVFELLEGLFNTQYMIPSPSLLKNYSMSKKAKELLKDSDVPESLVDAKAAQLAINSLLFQSLIDYLTVDARVGLQDVLNSDIVSYEETLQDYISDMSIALSYAKLKHTRSSIMFGDEYINKARARYAKAKVDGSYIVCKFGYKHLDEQLGGIANNDFINILAYVKQYKSTLMRNIAYNAILQGKNILIITMEMSDEEIEAEMQSMHSSNKARFGNGRPMITSNGIKEASLTDDEDNYLFNEVIQDLANADDLGIIKVINPSDGEYYYADLIADINETRAAMDVDVIFIDYLTMIKPKKTYTRDDVNDMFKSIRKYALSNRIPVINAVQVGRAAYNDMLEDEHNRYKPDSASDYNEVERSSTIMLSIAQTPEQKPSNEVMVSCILSRRANVDSMPFKSIRSGNGKIVEITSTDSPEEDLEEVLGNITLN